MRKTNKWRNEFYRRMCYCLEHGAEHFEHLVVEIKTLLKQRPNGSTLRAFILLYIENYTYVLFHQKFKFDCAGLFELPPVFKIVLEDAPWNFQIDVSQCIYNIWTSMSRIVWIFRQIFKQWQDYIRILDHMTAIEYFEHESILNDIYTVIISYW